jgi:hypothetical protein
MPGNEMYDPAGRDASDTLDGDPGDDPLDQGIAPPDRWSAGEGFGTTAAEEQEGETLDQLLAEEEPEPDPYSEAERVPYGDEEDRRADDLFGDAAPEPRAGRLVADDEGTHADSEPDLVAHDVGIDAGAASAEEAAVHVQDDDSD